MFYSDCLLSQKGPLRSIWVAAYFIKKLKKAQIFETDISSSVDKILQDEFEALTYRVLAYLLLGVVRIYSKKVEYLYDDCNEVLVQIKDFVVKKKYKAQLEIPSASYFSITVPERFELDAFDLEILEDAIEKNVRSQEEITLKDVAWDSQGSGQFYPDKYHFEDFDVSCSTCSIGFSKAEEELELQFMDIDNEEGTSVGLDKLDEIIEKLRCDGSYIEGSLYCATIFGPEKERPIPITSHGESDHTDNEHEEAPEVVPVEKHVSREADSNKSDGQEERVNFHSEDEVSRKADSNKFDGQEERVNLHSENEVSREADGNKFDGQEEHANLHSGDEVERLLPCEPFGEDQTHEENINGPNTAPVESMMHPMEADNNVSILEFEANTEKLQDDRLPHVELQQPSGDDQPDSNKFDGQEEHANLHSGDEVERLLPCEPFGEDQTHEENINGPNTAQVESMMHPMEADNNVSILEFEANAEELQDDRLPHVDLQQPSGDDQPDVEQKILPEVTCSKKRKRKVSPEDHPLSVNVDATPRTKLPEASGSGTTPKFMLLPTPAIKEHTRFSRKRRCVFDDLIVYPNSVIKQWINDSSDLVRKRKKDVHNSRAAWTEHCTANLVLDFSKPLVPCPLELIPLHYGKRVKVQKFVEIAKTPEKIEVSAPVKLPGNVEVPAPIILPENLEVPAPTRFAENVEVSSPPVGRSSEQRDIAPLTPVGRSSEQRDIAPLTPVRCSTTLRSFGRRMHNNDDMEEEEPLDAQSTGKDDKEPATSLRVEASTSTHPIVEKDSSVSKVQVVNSPGKDDKEPATSLSVEASTSTHPIEEKDPSPSKDREVNSSGKDDKVPATSRSVEASTSTHPVEEKDPSASKDREVNSSGKDDKVPAMSQNVEASTSTRPTEEKDPSVSKDQEVNSPGNDEKEPSTSIVVESCAHPFGTEEKDSSVSKDQEVDLNFMSKDEFSNDSDIQGQDGWSERTRLVAKLLRKSFLDKKSRGEEEKVKLLSMVRGKTKKESARLFYEILVLKTKDFVEVQQVYGFGDILVLKSKAPQCDQAYAM